MLTRAVFGVEQKARPGCNTNIVRMRTVRYWGNIFILFLSQYFHMLQHRRYIGFISASRLTPRYKHFVTGPAKNLNLPS